MTAIFPKWVVAVLILIASAVTAEAASRVALVVGISNYKNVSRLDNPNHDADAVAGLLKGIGFIVRNERDLDNAGMRRAVREFSDAAKDSDQAVVYFAGHGMEVDGSNYLVPSDAKLASDFDIEDETMSLERVTRALDGAKSLRLIILDACRNNPFVRSMRRNSASRSVGRGLARVEPTTSNTLIAFAAKAGGVAADGIGQNSPFAAALVHHIAEPNLDLRLAFGRVRDEVLKATENRQEPFVYGSLGGQTVALVIKPQLTSRPDKSSSVENPPRLNATPEFEAALRRTFSTATGSKSVTYLNEAVENYLAAYPNKAIALATKNRRLFRSTVHENESAARERALESCQMRYNQSCVLIVLNNAILDNEKAKLAPRLAYNGKFDATMIPSIREPVRNRDDVKNFGTAAEPKVMAIHPWGRVFTASAKSSSLKEAARTALADCNADPTREGQGGPCFIYSLNNDVVLFKRMTAP